MTTQRALTWQYNEADGERDRIFGYAVVTETELLIFALSSKDSSQISRQVRTDLPPDQVEAVVRLLDAGKAKNPYRLKRDEVTAIGYITAASKLRIETKDQALDLAGFPYQTDLVRIATEMATTVFPDIEPHSEQVAATLAVQDTYLKAIGSVAAACIGLLVLAFIGGQDDFDSNARGSGIARLLGAIPLPVLLLAFAAALAYPIFLMVKQAKRGYVMRVWLLDEE